MGPPLKETRTATVIRIKQSYQVTEDNNHKAAALTVTSNTYGHLTSMHF